MYIFTSSFIEDTYYKLHLLLKSIGILWLKVKDPPPPTMMTQILFNNRTKFNLTRGRSTGIVYTRERNQSFRLLFMKLIYFKAIV